MLVVDGGQVGGHFGALFEMLKAEVQWASHEELLASAVEEAAICKAALQALARLPPQQLHTPPAALPGCRLQVNDSSAIISRLAAEIEAAGGSISSSGGGSQEAGGGGVLAGLFGGKKGKGGKAQPSSGTSPTLAPASLAEEEKWRRWVDDWFVKVCRGEAEWQVGSFWEAAGRGNGYVCCKSCSRHAP